MKDCIIQVQNVCTEYSELIEEEKKIDDLLKECDQDLYLDKNIKKALAIIQEIGEYFQNESDNDHALKIYDLSYKIFNTQEQNARTNDTSIVMLEILNAQIGILFTISDLKTAQEKIIISLEIAQKQQNKEALLIPTNNYGIFYFYQSKYDIALDYFNQGLELATTQNNIPAIVKALGNIGNINLIRYDYTEAMKCYQKLISYLDPEGTDSDKRYCAICYKNIGEIYLRQGNIDKAIDYFHKRIILAEELGDKQGICIGYASLGSAYQIKGFINRSKIFLHKALIASEEIGNKAESDKILANLSLIYYDEKDYDKAETLLRKKHVIAKQLDNKESFVPIYSTLGLIASKKGEYNKAIKLFTKQQRYAEETGMKIETLNALINAMDVYFELGRFKLVRKLADRILKMGQIIKDMSSVMITNLVLAHVELHLGNYHLSESCLNKTLELSIKLNDKTRKAESLFGLAELNYDLEKNEKAEELANQALNLAIESGHIKIVFGLKILIINIKVQKSMKCNELENCIKQLYILLDQHHEKHDEKSKIAVTCYTLWQAQLKLSEIIGTDENNDKKIEQNRKLALEMYKEIYQIKPKFYYKERILELRN